MRHLLGEMATGWPPTGGVKPGCSGHVDATDYRNDPMYRNPMQQPSERALSKIEGE
jgi:hypothetical protein